MKIAIRLLAVSFTICASIHAERFVIASSDQTVNTVAASQAPTYTCYYEEPYYNYACPPECDDCCDDIYYNPSYKERHIFEYYNFAYPYPYYGWGWGPGFGFNVGVNSAGGALGLGYGF